MSYTAPGRKGNVYLGTFQKMERFGQKLRCGSYFKYFKYFQWIEAVGIEFKG